jgi:hypothetical protein
MNWCANKSKGLDLLIAFVCLFVCLFCRNNQSHSAFQGYREGRRKEVVLETPGTKWAWLSDGLCAWVSYSSVSSPVQSRHTQNQLAELWEELKGRVNFRPLYHTWHLVRHSQQYPLLFCVSVDTAWHCDWPNRKNCKGHKGRSRRHMLLTHESSHNASQWDSILCCCSEMFQSLPEPTDSAWRHRGSHSGLHTNRSSASEAQPTPQTLPAQPLWRVIMAVCMSSRLGTMIPLAFWTPAPGDHSFSTIWQPFRSLCLLLCQWDSASVGIFFFFFLVLVFLRQGFSVWPWLSWNSLCRPGWPRTQKSACLCLPSAGIKGMRQHHGS